MDKWIEVHYKCKCFSKEQSFHIPSRKDEEPIEDFMERVQLILTHDHSRLSPFCKETSMEYAKVPVGGDLIGGAEGGTA